MSGEEASALLNTVEKQKNNKNFNQYIEFKVQTGRIAHIYTKDITFQQLHRFVNELHRKACLSTVTII